MDTAYYLLCSPCYQNYREIESGIMSRRRTEAAHLSLGGLAHAEEQRKPWLQNESAEETREFDAARHTDRMFVDTQDRGGRANLWVALFVVALCTPLSYSISGVKLPIYKLLLVLYFFPAIFLFIKNCAQDIQAPDLLILLYVFWSAFALIFHHGSNGIEAAGTFGVEALGAFLLGRVFVTNANQFRGILTYLFFVMLVLAPLALFESLNNRSLLLELFSIIGDSHQYIQHEIRLGLYRSQGPFEHPILFGIFAGSILALAMHSKTFSNNFVNALFIFTAFVCTFFSLSSGSLLLISIVFILTVWRAALSGFSRRWTAFITITAATYLAIDILSDRTPFHVFVDYLTFNSTNSYNRILIWTYGTAEVARHPILGIGLSEWSRPIWMSSSMDNFWLVQAVRYGVPSLAAIVSAIGLVLLKLSKPAINDPSTENIKRAIAFSIVATAISVSSVHLWNATFSWLMFLIGAAVSISCYQKPESSEDQSSKNAAS